MMKILKISLLLIIGLTSCKKTITTPVEHIPSLQYDTIDVYTKVNGPTQVWVNNSIISSGNSSVNTGNSLFHIISCQINHNDTLKVSSTSTFGGSSEIWCYCIKRGLDSNTVIIDTIVFGNVLNVQYINY